MDEYGFGDWVACVGCHCTNLNVPNTIQVDVSAGQAALSTRSLWARLIEMFSPPLAQISAEPGGYSVVAIRLVPEAVSIPFSMQGNAYLRLRIGQREFVQLFTAAPDVGIVTVPIGLGNYLVDEFLEDNWVRLRNGKVVSYQIVIGACDNQDEISDNNCPQPTFAGKPIPLIGGKPIHVFWSDKTHVGAVLPEDAHNIFYCAGAGTYPLFSTTLVSDSEHKTWGYRFTGNEPERWTGEYFFSNGMLLAEGGQPGARGAVTTLERGHAYYITSDTELFIDCVHGIDISGTCGDGIVGNGEQCDAGSEGNSNVISNACRADCTTAHCGDGVMDTGEECDDGNAASGDGCSKHCTVETRCGDGVLNAGEECDDGVLGNSDELPGTCRMDCALPSCGDGVADPGEECDDGNTAGGDGCSVICDSELVLCGNGIIESGEECDDGIFGNSDELQDACRLDCTLPACGDGVCDSNEGAAVCNTPPEDPNACIDYVLCEEDCA